MLADIRYAARSLCRWRLGAVMAVVTLTLGIGTATSLYAFLRAVLASQTPQIEGIDSVGRIYASSRNLGVERAPLPMSAFRSLLAASASFESIAAYVSDEREMTLGAATATISVGQVTEDFFEVFRARPALGRLISREEARTREPVAVVSDSFWRRYFSGRSPGALSLTIDGTTWTVVGVLPPEFGFPFLGINADAWTWMATDESTRAVSVIARTRSGQSWTAASAELDAAAKAQIADGLWTWRAIPVKQDVGRRVGTASAFLLGPAFVVLLIGCVNVSCLLLARGIERQVELSVRYALGATRTRIVRQLVAEHVLLATLAGVLGSGLAAGVLRAISARMAAFRVIPPPALSLDAATLWVALGVSLLAAALFGTLPAVRISRRDVAASLKGHAAADTARFVGYHARDLVVFVELALAVVLIVVAAMWLQLFAKLQRITPMFAADQVVAARVQTAKVGIAAGAVGSLPGVTGVAVASSLPGGRSPVVYLQTQSGRLARAALMEVQPSFFTTVGLPILRGRTFESAEVDAQSKTLIVSEAVVTDLWPNEDPLGATLRVRRGNGTDVAVVIGVCADVLKVGSLAKVGIIHPDIYVPFDPKSTSESVLLVRSSANAHALVRPIEALLNNGRLGSTRAAVVADGNPFVRDESLFLVRLIGVFGLIALGLAATGVFGVLSQSVSQRTTEFGVRMAVGATARDVLLMVLVREGKLIGAAIVTGAAGTLLVTRVVFAELAAISAHDVRLWAAVATVCGGFAAAAAVLATRRIVRLDPWAVLRMR